MANAMRTSKLMQRLLAGRFLMFCRKPHCRKLAGTAKPQRQEPESGASVGSTKHGETILGLPVHLPSLMLIWGRSFPLTSCSF